jgi:hypothetical protein
MSKPLAAAGCLLTSLTILPTAQAQCHTQQLTASDAADIDVFGWSLDLDGDVAALGAIGNDDACIADPNCNSGSVYIFRRAAGVWTEEAKLTCSDAVTKDEFGHDVAISGDRVLVGAHMKDSGAVYSFAFDGNNWIEEQKLVGSGTQATFHFGHSVEQDGGVAVIGTMRDDHQGFESGSAYVFERQGGAWVERAKLVASDAASGDRYGRSCGIQGDYIAVGAHLHDGVGADSGAAYVYERDDNGTAGNPSDDTWPEVAALVPADTEAGMKFGRCVDFSGNVLIVGAEFGKSAGVATGAAYIYFRSGGTWIEVQKLVPSDGQAGDAFGISVALEGVYALVGARAADANGADSGAVYVFTRTPAGYIQTGKLLGPDSVAGDQLGHETGVQVAGSTALISSRFSAASGAFFGGSAYAFDLDDCLGTSYCDVTPNSAGPGAEIRAAGIQSISGNDFTLISAGAIPNKVGLFFYGPNQIDIPLGNGKLCVGGVVRLNPPILADGAGTAVRPVDFTVFPAGSGANQITAGTTWNFQHWFRDQAAGPGQFNLSDGVSCTFIP